MQRDLESIDTLADFGSLNPPSSIPVGLAASSRLSPFRTNPCPKSEHRHLIRPCHICYTEAGSLDRATTAARRRSASMLTVGTGHQASNLRFRVKRVAYAAQPASSESTSTVVAGEAKLRLCTPPLSSNSIKLYAPRTHLTQTIITLPSDPRTLSTLPSRAGNFCLFRHPANLTLLITRQLCTSGWLRPSPAHFVHGVPVLVCACVQPIFGSCRCHDATEPT